MAIEEINPGVTGGAIGSPGEVVIDVASALGSLGRWLQAIGAVIILWIVFHAIAWFLNRKRLKELYKIKDDIVRIESKIDKIAENTRKK